MKKILIVDDEQAIIDLLRDFLEIDGFQVVATTNSSKAMDLLDEEVASVLLDINMEKKSGIQLCKEIREVSKVPIIFVTCNSTQTDKLLGLGIGADDYITKPFDPLELVARVKVNIRRSEYFSHKPKNSICFDDITIYTNNYKVYKGEQELKLSSKEFALLNFFVKNTHIVLSREKILTRVWGDDYYNENVVNTTVKRLRDKLSADTHKDYIKTMRSVGYLFDADVKEVE